MIDKQSTQAVKKFEDAKRTACLATLHIET